MLLCQESEELRVKFHKKFELLCLIYPYLCSWTKVPLVLFLQVYKLYLFSVYVDIGNDRNTNNSLAAILDVRFGLFTGGRQFSLRVSQIECHHILKPTDGCLQYFTGIEGRELKSE